MEKLFIRNMQIDRSKILIAKNNNVLDEQDIEYWNNASNDEKFQTITYLRECFYGDEATTGHVQRSYTIFNRSRYQSLPSE